MISRRQHLSICVGALLLAGSAAASARALSAVDQLALQPDWQASSPASVRGAVIGWLAREPLDQATRARAEALWAAEDSSAAPAQHLERLVATFALVRADVRRLVARCAQPETSPAADDFRFLTDPRCDPLLRHNMRLIYGRWLAQHNLFDEAHELIGDLQTQDVVDPATLLFYQAVVHHRLTNLQESEEKLTRLLQREDELPRRYRHLARLLRSDLSGVKEDSLDHIARRMDDIRRRLYLGRANKKVRQIEDGVIASLDKLLKQLEDQAQQQQSQGTASGQLQPNSPAPDSRILAGRGPGKVDKKRIGDKADWGNLPDKQRQQAMQQIGRQFPSHYRQAVEQYFKRLAQEQ